MRFYKLRIAWSVVCGTICLMLIVLCVRSYFRLDHLSYEDKWLSSLRGHILIQGSFNFDNPVDYFNAKSLKLFGGGILLRSFSGDIAYDDGGIAIPDWAVVAPVVAVGVFPWIRWPERFSLRTLLIAVTLVAVVLGLVAWSIR
jgi:hypothetical protein